LSELKAVAGEFIEALSANSADRYADLLAEDVSLLSNRWTGQEVYRQRFRVVKRLMNEWSGWPDPSIALLYIYGWMPVIDPAVIKSLVPQ
jgi:hypothetical protein